MDLFAADPRKITASGFTIEGPEAAHILKVMRKKTGDRIFFTDGQGWQYQGLINETTRTSLKGSIIGRVLKPREPALELVLAFGMLKGSRNDFLIEKCTEMGITAFQPFYSRSSVMARARAGRLQRLERIARSAMKQSLRTVCPRINPPIPFEQLVKSFGRFEKIWLAHEMATERLSLSSGVKNGLLVVGPEGGFTADEYREARSAGAFAFSLGSTRLRSETAAIAGVALILVGRS